jgi:REP element-mobilizing transposase RayT
VAQHKYNYRRRLPHIQKDFRPLFITFTTAKRWRIPEEARDVVMQCCLAQHGRMFDLHAAVVMPDHVHLVLTPLRGEDGWIFSLPEIMRVVKSTTAQAINKSLGRQGSVWQQESFDHVLRSNERLAETVDYVCRNPVRAGLAHVPEQYRWFWRGVVPVI